MPQNTWWSVFRPSTGSQHPGGIDALTRATDSKIFDDFESYANDGALQAVWSVTNGGVGDPQLTTAANAIKGRQSLQITATGGVGVASRGIPNNTFGFPVGSSTGRIRYVAFKMISSSGNQTIRVRLADASDATLYKEWQFTVAQEKTRDFVIDLYSGSTTALTGGGFLNTESYPGPIAEGATAWNPALIDQLSFRNLTDTIIFRVDDIRFFYEYSLMEAIGFGTEPVTDDGADGSIHSKLRYLNNIVLQLIGSTDEYNKYGPAEVRLNNSYTWGLELKGMAEQGIPSTTEITPGNYTINRVRNGTTTEIVASTGATEAAGFISATYTPLEDNWQLGDEIVVAFSGGRVDSDTDTAITPTSNIAGGATTIQLANAALFQVGQRIRIYDDLTTEYNSVVSVDSPTQITVTATANAYTSANNFRVVLVERNDLQTARFAANVTYQPEITAELERWVLADYDDFDFADADGNNERWDVGYIANSDGSAAGAEGGIANINTSTAGQARVSVDPDVTPTQAAYALKRDTVFLSKYYSVMVDVDATLDASQATSNFAGLRISAGDVDDPSNYILIAKETSSAVNRITARAEFIGAAQPTVNFNTTDTAVAFKIERYENTWNIFYSLTQYPNWIWTKLTQYEDANGDMTGSTSVYLYTESGGTVDAQTAVADFDNWKYYIGSGSIDQILGLLYLASGTFTTSSATVPADTGRTEGNDYWNYTLLMPINGPAAYQPRVIVDFANAGGVFTIDAQNTYTTAPNVGDEYVILAFQYPGIPAADATSNQTSAHVVGNKSDAASVTAGNASIIGRLRAIEAALSVNATGGGEFELDGVPDLWDALVNDSSSQAEIITLTGDRDGAVLERLAAFVNALQVTDAGTATGFEEDGTGGRLWESIIAVKGTFTTSSATVPADTGRAEANDYFNGDIIVPLTGDVIRQARVIVDFANAGGVFTLDPENIFTAAPGLVDYVILHFQYPLVPVVDSANNSTTSHVVGNKTDTIPAMNLAPGNDSIVRQLKAILERVGATPADPDDSLLTNTGQRDDTATLDDITDVTTTSIQAKLRRLLLRFSSDAFSSTVQGVARTDIENMIQGLANYLSSAGAAWSVTANPGGTAKDNLEQTLEDFANMLAGTTGIATFPLRAQAGDGVSIAEVLRHVSEATGEDTANNVFDSSTVIANEDGSVLERLENVQLTLDRAEYSLSDYDDFDVADADANTERWNTGYISGTEGGSADINTTTAGKLMVIVNPDATPTAAGYAVNTAQPFVSKYFSVISDVDATYGTSSGSWATTGIRVSLPAYDTNNVVYLQRQRSTIGVQNRLAAGAIFGGANQGEVYFTTTDLLVAFKIERLDNVWRLYYSLSQYPDYVWVLLTQYEDASENIDSQVSFFLDSYSPGTLDAETVQGDFDNYKVYLNLNGLSQEIAGDYDSSVVAADEDGSLAERLEQIQEAVNRGSGTSIAANRSLVDALGSDGTTVTDSAVSVLGTIGADNANNAFASTSVIANIDGSVLERLEAISSGIIVGTGTFTTSSATVPADTGHGARANDYFKGCLLIPLTGAVAFQPRLITSFATATGVFTLDAEEPFTAAPGLVTYVIVSAEAALVPAADSASNTTTAHVAGNKTDAIPAMNAAPANSSIIAHLKAILERVGATPADPDDSLLTTIGQRDDAVTVAATASVVSLLRDLIAGLGVVASGAGGGFEIDGAPTLVTALGTTGAVVTDSATSVLGAIGADNANNAFSSSSVAENGDGSVLERLEELRGKTDTTGSPFALTNVMGTVEQTVVDYTSTKNGVIAALFDLATLVTAGEGGNVTIRLKFMIDGVTLRTIDRADFMVGTDEVHPSVSGFVVEGASFVRLTIQVNSAVSVNRNIPFRIIES